MTWAVVAELVSRWLVGRRRVVASPVAFAVGDEVVADVLATTLGSVVPAIALAVLAAQWLPAVASVVVVVLLVVRAGTESARRRRVRERLWIDAGAVPP